MIYNGGWRVKCDTCGRELKDRQGTAERGIYSTKRGALGAANDDAWRVDGAGRVTCQYCLTLPSGLHGEQDLFARCSLDWHIEEFIDEYKKCLSDELVDMLQAVRSELGVAGN